MTVSFSMKMFFVKDLFAHGNGLSLETSGKGRNVYYQKQIDHQISSQTKQTLWLFPYCIEYSFEYHWRVEKKFHMSKYVVIGCQV